MCTPFCLPLAWAIQPSRWEAGRSGLPALFYQWPRDQLGLVVKVQVTAGQAGNLRKASFLLHEHSRPLQLVLEVTGGALVWCFLVLHLQMR